MTSKKSLKELKDKMISIDGRLCLIDKLRFESIEQDLEILEIIKKKAKENRFFKGCLLRMFQEDGEKKTYLDNPPRKIDKNYYKIKEWLENE